MPQKARQHYVPQFYLRGFASAPRRINLFSINTGNVIIGASLRDQCYGRKLHGDTPEVEDALADFEGKAATTLRQIQATRSLPARDTPDHAGLIAILTMQALRTRREAERRNTALDGLMKKVFKRDSRLNGIDLESFELRLTRPVLVSLMMWPHIAPYLSDLSLLLVQVPSVVGRLVTSDDPVVRYNLFTEGIRGMGTRGFDNRGLLLFFPLSPTLELILYDADVYKVPSKSGQLLVLNQKKDTR